MANKQVITNTKVPVILLDYKEREMAIKKELLLDYDNYRIYVVDAEDKTVIHDITQILVDEYLTKMDGDNVWVTIEGIEGKVNLSEILSDLNKNKIEIINTLPAEMMTPTNTRFDHRSITMYDNVIAMYGFRDAKPLSTPRKSLEGRIEWVGGEEGSIEDKTSNVTELFPIDGVITLFQKPNQAVRLNQCIDDRAFQFKLPDTNQEYYQIRLKIDSQMISSIVFDKPVAWYGGDHNILDTLESYVTYLLVLDTWDYGASWSILHYSNSNINVPDYLYLKENKYLLTDQNGTWLYCPE